LPSIPSYPTLSYPIYVATYVTFLQRKKENNKEREKEREREGERERLVDFFSIPSGYD